MLGNLEFDTPKVLLPCPTSIPAHYVVWLGSWQACSVMEEPSHLSMPHPLGSLFLRGTRNKGPQTSAVSALIINERRDQIQDQHHSLPLDLSSLTCKGLFFAGFRSKSMLRS